MRKTLLTEVAAVCLAATLPQVAFAAGGPVIPVQRTYIGVASSPYRYAAFGAGGATVVKRERRGATRSALERLIRGHYGIPGVDYKGALTGLSADGHTLILAEIPRNAPPRTTRLLVLDVPSLAIRSRIAMPGWSTVDAISPDGRWLYLIHYPSSDISKYEVLAYDVHAARLLPKPVIDPRDRGEAMTGFPMDRVMSADGRWAYTLYWRPSGVPFIHALDTTQRRAVCIDLPELSNVNGNMTLRLIGGGSSLQVNAPGVTAPVRVDTRTFAVRTDAGGSPSTALARPRSHRSARGGAATPWAIIILLIVGLGGGAAAGMHRSRRRQSSDQSLNAA